MCGCASSIVATTWSVVFELTALPIAMHVHRRATAAVLPPSRKHRYAQCASFSKRHTVAVLPELELISAVPLGKHRAAFETVKGRRVFAN